MASTVQTVTSNFNISFCSKMAVLILQKQIEKESNFVFSPLSFQLMLSLIAVGSKGSTLEQLLFFLGSKSIDELNDLASIANSVFFSENESKGKRKRKLLETSSPPMVSFVNGAWVDKKFGLKPSFEKVLKTVYHATAKEVDFANKADQVAEEVNLWVKNASKGLIRNLLPKQCLDSDTALVLANALYFKGSWNRKFDVSKTKHKEFHLLNGQIIEAPFMTSKEHEKHLYGSFDGYKVLKLPYQYGPETNRFSMYFFLPNVKNGSHNIIEIFKSTPEFYKKEVQLQEVELPEFWIPRFKFSFKTEASDALKELGLALPFFPLGEFTEMADSAPSELLALSKIFHESAIEVNELGTEAAAATAPEFRWLCAIRNPPSFVADHPFLFIIKEEISGLVLFIGAVLNPLMVS